MFVEMVSGQDFSSVNRYRTWNPAAHPSTGNVSNYFITLPRRRHHANGMKIRGVSRPPAPDLVPERQPGRGNEPSACGKSTSLGT